MMKINDLGLNLIKYFEGLALEAYQDIGGIWTIGYGHIDSVKKGQKITEEEATNILLSDIATRCAQLEANLFTPVTSNEFSALTCFVFNLGIGSLRGSHLLAKLNAGDKMGAANEFMKWNHVKGKVISGLTRRRIAERQLFLTPDGKQP